MNDNSATEVQPKQAVTAFGLVTDRIIQHLETAIDEGYPQAPWDSPWYTEDNLPRSARTGEPYRGVNRFTLGLLGIGQSPFWATTKGVSALGGTVLPEQMYKNGGPGYAPIVKWNWANPADVERAAAAGKPIQRCWVQWFRVWNLSQTTVSPDNYPEIEKRNFRREFTPIDECERIVKDYRQAPKILYQGSIASYHPDTDVINMPEQDRFLTDADLYSVLFHEMIHSTGHKDRINREEITNPKRFGTPSYAREELVAELGSCLLSASAGILKTTNGRSYDYLRGWLQKLKNDVRLLPLAAQSAQKAAEFVLGA